MSFTSSLGQWGDSWEAVKTDRVFLSSHPGNTVMVFHSHLLPPCPSPAPERQWALFVLRSSEGSERLSEVSQAGSGRTAFPTLASWAPKCQVYPLGGSVDISWVKLIPMSVRCSLIGDAIDLASSSEAPGAHTRRVRSLRTSSAPAGGGRGAAVLLRSAPRCSSTWGRETDDWLLRGLALSRSWVLFWGPTESNALLHHTSLLFSPANRWKCFQPRAGICGALWRGCGSRGEPKGEENTLALGAGVRRGRVWTWTKRSVWRNAFGKFWLWLSFPFVAELRGRVEMGGRASQDAHSAGAGHRASHQPGLLPQDQPQLPGDSDPKDVPADVWERDLAFRSSALQAYQLVYIFILFLYLLIWNQDIKKNASILILYQIWHLTPEWLHCFPLMLDLGSPVFWVELVIITAACIFSGSF